MKALPVVIDPQAEQDLFAAMEWYDQHRDGLGDRFVRRLDELLTTVSSQPAGFVRVYDDVRRGLMKQFPYAVYYRPDAGLIRVIAILHTSRRPDYWRPGGGEDEGEGQ